MRRTDVRINAPLFPASTGMTVLAFLAAVGVAGSAESLRVVEDYADIDWATSDGTLLPLDGTRGVFELTAPLPMPDPATIVTTADSKDREVIDARIRHAAEKREECNLEISGGIPRLRLVINSHHAYAHVLQTLLAGLIEVGFRQKKDAIIVVAGSPKNVDPYRGKDGWFYIKTTQTGMDWTALSLLFKHRKHEQVAANAYLYIPDTTTPSGEFPRLYAQLKVRQDEVQVPLRPNSNLFAFGSKYICAYQTTFDDEIDKDAGVSFEWGNIIREVTRLDPSLHVMTLPPRLKEGTVDIYKNGHARTKMYYPYFGMYKYIPQYFGAGGVPANQTIARVEKRTKDA